jgi:hypothetical protein
MWLDWYDSGWRIVTSYCQRNMNVDSVKDCITARSFRTFLYNEGRCGCSHPTSSRLHNVGVVYEELKYQNRIICTIRLFILDLEETH